mmetsp:Transcript_44118/g.71503  ORF Transcript_44118/g.71503 Transcript_44118/m.71503 type:complete len:86 (+) Transcript_44118:217-474(+)
MAKCDVNGPKTHPVYQFLKGPGGSDIRWNFFTKFLVRCEADQCTIFRYDGAPNPLALEADISRLLPGGSGDGGSSSCSSSAPGTC